MIVKGKVPGGSLIVAQNGADAQLFASYAITE